MRFVQVLQYTKYCCNREIWYPMSKWYRMHRPATQTHHKTHRRKRRRLSRVGDGQKPPKHPSSKSGAANETTAAFLRSKGLTASGLPSGRLDKRGPVRSVRLVETLHLAPARIAASTMADARGSGGVSTRSSDSSEGDRSGTRPGGEGGSNVIVGTLSGSGAHASNARGWK